MKFAWTIALLLGIAAYADETPLTSGVDRAAFDTSVSPGTDFFQYVNGAWNKANPIPPEYSDWGSFSKLRDDNLIALRVLVEDLVKPGATLDDNRRKLRDFYATATDDAKLDSQGDQPLREEFEAIAKIQTREDFLAYVAHLHGIGVEVLFGTDVDQDEKQSDRYVFQLWQGGMGMPERDYYVGTSDESKAMLAQYKEHVAKMLQLIGDSSEAAKSGAEAVVAIETKLAEAARSPTALRDREKNYNKKDLADLAKLTPNVDWKRYLVALNAKPVDYVVVGQPEFLQRVSELTASVPIERWRTYLRWQLLHSLASSMGGKIELENFRFFGQVMRGAKEMTPRWKKAIRALDDGMGEALGKLYVEKYFTPQAKARMDELVKNLLAAYAERIATRDWMGPETKKKAMEKLATVMPKIGYPSKWRDYSSLEIKADSLAQNVMRARAFEVKYRLSHLGQPVDRTVWGMTTPTVNAYYNATLNEIVFPAGMLQPPFFDPKADDAVNYGAIGAVIGHEITHGFDDQGSRSDGMGNLKEWWTPEDRSRFNAKTEQLVKQYNACVVVGNAHINGKLTLGENIADLGGVTIAYAAYLKSLGGKEAPVLDGFTGPQRFFIGFARAWRGTRREAYERLLIRTDPHSPYRYRTLIPLSNVKAFYDAFEVKETDKMYRKPRERVEVW